MYPNESHIANISTTEILNESKSKQKEYQNDTSRYVKCYYMDVPESIFLFHFQFISLEYRDIMFKLVYSNFISLEVYENSVLIIGKFLDSEKSFNCYSLLIITCLILSSKVLLLSFNHFLFS